MNGLIIVSAVAVFLIVIWLLVAVLLFARKKMVPEGNVKLTVNQKHEINHERGCTLLQALSDEKIFMPSACGGGGTCGYCKGKVLSGGGNILSTETAHIDRKMQEEHYRLYCQVKVKDDMEIEIPDEVFGVKKWQCTVISNHNVATFIKELTVRLPAGETIDFKSGGYIQIDVPAGTVHYSDMIVEEQYKDDWNRDHLFDLTMKNPESCMRAYSMASYPEEKEYVKLNVRIAVPPYDSKKKTMAKVNPGIASSYIFSLKEGDSVTLSGPYGEFFVQETQNEMMFIGGGAGMAPMRSHIFDQFKTKQTKRKTTFWYGGRSKRELFYLNDFEEIAENNPNFSFHLALSDPKPEDNWTGYTGFIHQVIQDQYLKKHPNPEDIEYYICGPKPMLDAILKMLDNLGVPQSMIFYDDFGG